MTRYPPKHTLLSQNLSKENKEELEHSAKPINTKNKKKIITTHIPNLETTSTPNINQTVNKKDTIPHTGHKTLTKLQAFIRKPLNH